MIYGDLKNLIEDLHAGGDIPDSLDNLATLVLGKIARIRLKELITKGTITTGGETEFDMADLFPDFLAFKSDAENQNRCIYYLESTIPFWIRLTNPSRFSLNTEGGFAYLQGRTLVIDWPTGATIPTYLYFHYYSKYLVLDENGSTKKEAPENDGDKFLFNSVFDDVFVEGVGLYLRRREMDDNEFIKASQEWQKSFKDIVFYQ